MQITPSSKAGCLCGNADGRGVRRFWSYLNSVYNEECFAHSCRDPATQFQLFSWQISESISVPHNVLDNMSQNNSRRKSTSRVFGGRFTSILERDLSSQLPNGTSHATFSYFHFTKFTLSYTLTPPAQSILLCQNHENTVTDRR